LHYFDDSPYLDIEGWIDANKYEVTLITQTQTKLRFFWPIILGKQDIKKGITSLHKMISHSSKNNVPKHTQNICEYFVKKQYTNKSFGVAF
jgi:hypothetical protein